MIIFLCAFPGEELDASDNYHLCASLGSPALSLLEAREGKNNACEITPESQSLSCSELLKLSCY